MKYLKLSFLIISMFSFFIVKWNSFWYFENKYYCNISWNSVFISLNSNSNNEKCLNLINNINNRINDYKFDIDTANYYISLNDQILYWTNVRDNLSSQISYLNLLKDSIINSMNRFEYDFFIRLSNVVFFDLKRQNIEYQKSLNLIKNNMRDAINDWNLNTFILYQEKLDEILIRIAINEKIISSTNFEEMIPFLRERIKLN